jgi:Flp pilus assembly pilin Flp
MIIQAVLGLVADDSGQDLVEYALLSGIIGTIGILLFPGIADGMRAAYARWQSGTQAAWEPAAPGS